MFNKSLTSSKILDLIRFISALVVFLYHFGFNLPGYQAVMIFFVLSGYFIGQTVLKDVRSGNWSWKNYLIKRTVRLYIVLIPALLLTYFWAKLQISLFGGAAYFDGTLDLKTLLGNLFFLQSIEVQQFGLNGPLWSLSYEFWYYILFPCIILFFHSKKIYQKLLYLIIFTTISIFVGEQIMLYFTVWLLGAALAFIKPIVLKKQIIGYVLVSITSIIAIFSTTYPYKFYDSFNWTNPHYLPDLFVAISFTLLFYLIIITFNQPTKSKHWNIATILAGFSYTLYLVHYPLLYFWKAMLSSSYWTFGTLETLIIKMIYLLLIVIYSYVLALMTEFHTGKITNKIFSYKKK